MNEKTKTELIKILIDIGVIVVREKTGAYANPAIAIEDIAKLLIDAKLLSDDIITYGNSEIPSHNNTKLPESKA